MLFKKKLKPYHEEKITISSNDIDGSYKLKMSGFFKLVQDVIMHDTTRFNVSSSDIKKDGLIWVIARVRVDIKRMPKYQEEVTFITYPGKTIKMLFPRYIRVVDKDGNVIINMSSIWAIMDEKTRIPLMNSPIMDKAYSYHMEDELPLPIKLSPVETSLAETRKVHYSDVDMNKHLNNTRYIEILQDIRTSDFYKTHPIKSMTINYLKEIKEGETINVYSNDSSPEYIEVKTGDSTCFVACVEYH